MKHADYDTIHKLQLKMLRKFKRVPKSGKEVEYLGKKFIVSRNVFWPSTDSKTIVTNFKIKKGETVLDLGTGAGNIAIMSAYAGAKKVIAVDINPDAVKCAKNNIKIHKFSKVITVRRGNVFEPINKREKFDVITFNLPFMNKPTKNLYERCMWDTDLVGHKAFFKDVNKFLKPKGRVYVTQANFGEIKEMKKMAKNAGFSIKKIGETKMTDIPRTYYAFELTRKSKKK